MNEFAAIQHFFTRSSHPLRSDVKLGIGDDAALLQPPPGQLLAMTTDTLVSGRHFPEQTCAADIAHKALAVNLSDLAAMGATPAWILLALTLPELSDIWLDGFTKSFFQLMDRFACQLVGGDLTQGPLSITIQAIGFVSPQNVLRRQGAQPGDLIYVTGHLGDAGLALACLEKPHLFSLTSGQQQTLLQRLNRPEPRVASGLALSGLASSAIDISDGLAADLTHLLQASQVGAIIQTAQLPLSPILKTFPAASAWSWALSAGDDYELCFTVPREKQSFLAEALKDSGCSYHLIGEITQGDTLQVLTPEKNSFSFPSRGFEHFKKK